MNCPSDPGTCYYLIANSTFINNSAGINGGAINYNYNKPVFLGNNTFSNNSAQYGKNIASYPVFINYIPTNISTKWKKLSDKEAFSYGHSNEIIIALDAE